MKVLVIQPDGSAATYMATVKEPGVLQLEVKLPQTALEAFAWMADFSNETASNGR